MRGALNVCAIKGPGFGKSRVDMTEDVAIATGAKFITETGGNPLSDLDLSWMGSSEKVVIDKESTTIIRPQGDPIVINQRVSELDSVSSQTISNYDKEQITKRISRLTGGVAVIQIGAVTETEFKEKKDRFDDSLAASKAAIEEGIVPGGGTTLLRASAYLESNPLNGSNDEINGYNSVITALREPTTQICNNAGYQAPIKVAEILNNDTFAVGLDASTDEICDMYERGIVDPAKVTRNAVQNAASIAGIAVISECIIDDIPNENGPMMPMMGM
jgi:chaperonin GroEL